MRDKVPLSRGSWAGGIAFHVAMSFVVIATYYLGRIWSYSLWWDALGPAGFWDMALRNSYGRNIIDMAYYRAVLAFGYSLEIHQRYKNEEVKTARVDPRRFIRIHRSTIVNIDRLRKLSPASDGEYAVVLQDVTKLKLSRGYHERIATLLRQAL